MKTLLMLVALSTIALAPLTSFAGRDGLQLLQQEQQNRRAIEERRSLVSVTPEMRAMMEECMKTMKK